MNIKKCARALTCVLAVTTAVSMTGCTPFKEGFAVRSGGRDVLTAGGTKQTVRVAEYPRAQGVQKDQVVDEWGVVWQKRNGQLVEVGRTNEWDTETGVDDRRTIYRTTNPMTGEVREHQTNEIRFGTPQKSVPIITWEINKGQNGRPAEKVGPGVFYNEDMNTLIINRDDGNHSHHHGGGHHDGGWQNRQGDGSSEELYIVPAVPQGGTSGETYKKGKGRNYMKYDNQ